MFNNKKDPLTNTIKDIMNRTALRNKVEEALNEQLGVSSRKAIPHEYLAQYDAMLAEQHAKAEKKTGAPTEGDKAEADQFKSTGEISGDRTETRGPDYLKKLTSQGAYTRKDKKEQLQEKAPPGKKYERMVKDIKEKYAKDGLTAEEKSIAYATARKAKNEEKMDESLQSLQEEIRNSLTEKLNYIYENYGEGAAQYAYDQLTEQERGILSRVRNWWNSTPPLRQISQNTPSQRRYNYQREDDIETGSPSVTTISNGKRTDTPLGRSGLGNQATPAAAGTSAAARPAPAAPQKTDYSRVGRQSALGDDERGPASVTTFSNGKRTDTPLRGSGLGNPATVMRTPTPTPAASGAGESPTSTNAGIPGDGGEEDNEIPSVKAPASTAPKAPASTAPKAPAARPAPKPAAPAPATSSIDWTRVSDGGSGSPFASEPSTTRSVRQAPERKSSSSFSRATKGDWSGTGDGGA